MEEETTRQLTGEVIGWFTQFYPERVRKHGVGLTTTMAARVGAMAVIQVDNKKFYVPCYEASLITDGPSDIRSTRERVMQKTQELHPLQEMRSFIESREKHADGREKRVCKFV